MGLVVNQMQISTEDQDKTTFTFPWGTFAYKYLLFGLCNVQENFQHVILWIFSNLLNPYLEISMTLHLTAMILKQN